MSLPCKGNLDKLLSLMDGSLRPRAAERLHAHLERCPGCAEAHRRLSRTRALFREINNEEPGDLSWKRIEAQLHWQLAKQQPRERRPARALKVFALASTAAAGLLIGVLFLAPLVKKQPAAPTPPAPALATSPAPAPLPVEELAALVTKLQGEAYLLPTRGHRTRLEMNRPLLQGDRVLTRPKGRLAMQWEQGTGLRMVPQSEVELLKMNTARQKIALWQGQAFLQVRKRNPGQAFTVVAQGIRVLVKGTHLSVAVNPDQVSVECYSGMVQVEPVDQRWEAVQVPAGFRVSVLTNSNSRPVLTRVEHSPPASLLNLQPWPSFQRVMASSGILPVRTRPAGLELRLDSQPVGSTNIQLRSPYKNRLVELYQDGRLVQRRWVDFTPAMSGKVFSMRPSADLPDLTPAEVLVIRRTTRQHRAPQIRSCYERALKRDPKIEGVLTLQLRIAKDGTVARAKKLHQSTIKNQYVIKCALNRAQGWKFPRSKRGGAYTIKLPFNLTPR